MLLQYLLKSSNFSVLKLWSICLCLFLIFRGGPSLLPVTEWPKPQHISGDTEKEKQPSIPALLGKRHQKLLPILLFPKSCSWWRKLAVP